GTVKPAEQPRVWREVVIDTAIEEIAVLAAGHVRDVIIRESSQVRRRNERRQLRADGMYARGRNNVIGKRSAAATVGTSCLRVKQVQSLDAPKIPVAPGCDRNRCCL